MTFNLERPVRFSRDSEHKSLYSWSLQEMSPSGEKLGRDLIPWEWTIRLSATALRLHSSYQLERVLRDDGTPLTERREVAALVAQLRIDPTYSSEFRARGTRLSMLGTDREIAGVSLRIDSLDGEDGIERCSLWGCPSYTTEIDFRDKTVPDMLQIQFSVPPSRFRQLCEVARSSRTLALSVMLSRVSGFYSQWSPSISTDTIKILTTKDDHAVAMAPTGELTIPRLGEVGDFDLELVQHAVVYAPLDAGSDQDAEDESERSHLPAPIPGAMPSVDSTQNVLRELAITRKTITSLSIPIWIAVVLIGLMWLTR